MGLQKKFLLPMIAAAILVLGTLLALRPAQALSIWSASDTPAVAAESDSAAVELGVKFRSSVATSITGVKFYKGAGNTGTHKGSLWSSTGVKDANGVVLAGVYTSSFTTGDSSVALWAPVDQSVGAAADGTAIELGLKFQSSQAGEVTKIQLYKNPSDTATVHTVTLWSSAGVSLGTATTTSETVSGWQEATFAAPIVITANTTYTASYLSSLGFYSYTSGGLSGAFTNGPLTALASGGVYKYGGGFPDQSYNNTNYWVDVRLNAQ